MQMSPVNTWTSFCIVAAPAKFSCAGRKFTQSHNNVGATCEATVFAARCYNFTDLNFEVRRPFREDILHALFYSFFFVKATHH